MSPRTSRVVAILACLWLALVAGLAALAPGAITLATLTAVLQFATILSMVALGQAIVILCGGAGIDLSVGGTVSLTAMAGMLAVKAGLPGAFLPPLCLASGLALGLLNGVLVTRLRLLPLIATLGTFYVYSGAAIALTGGATLPGVPAYLLPWGERTLGGVPLTFLSTTVPCFLLAAVVLRSTSWGCWVYALGHDERSARLVGIPVDRVRRLAYGVSGLFAGIGALVSLAWLGSARPNIGQNLELTSLTAAMLGGIAIFGGRGGVGGVLAAVLLLVTLQTGLLQLNVNAIWQVGIVGALLLAVLAADNFRLIGRRA